MKKILFLSITMCLLISAQLSAQQVFEKDSIIISAAHKNRTYLCTINKAALDKDVVIVNRADSTRAEGYVKNGYTDGLWNKYKDDKLFQSIQFKDGYLHGEYRQYFLNGSLQQLIDMRKGEIGGRNIIYYPNGQISYETRIKNGQINGTQRHYDEQGEIISDSFFVDGKLEGKSVYRKKDGLDIKYTVIAYYKGNVLNGSYAEVLHNGVAKLKGTYKAGKKAGVWEYRSADGALLKTQVYDADGNLQDRLE